MDPADRIADFGGLAQCFVGGAQSVVEDDDPMGAALRHHQPLHLRVIDPADLVLVVEIGDAGVVTDKAEAVTLERKLACMVPAIAQRDAMLLRPAADPLVGGAGRADEGDRHRLGIDGVI